jgi:hypothetical protein
MNKITEAQSATKHILMQVDQAKVLLKTQGPIENAHQVINDVAHGVFVVESAMAQLNVALQLLKKTDWPTPADYAKR